MQQLVKSSDRTLAILELLTAHPEGLTFTEIQMALALPKSSAYTLLVTMTARGFLEQEHSSRRFRVGIRLWQAGKSYVAVADLEQVALSYMEGVRDALNETVHLATLDHVDNVYIAKVDPDQQLRLASRVGVRLPAYATGLGKALLTQLDDDEIQRRFADVAFIPFTPATITSVPQLLAAVREARARGYAVDTGEHTPGVYCIAVPVPRARLRRSTNDVAADRHDAIWSSAREAAMSVSIPEVRRTPALVAEAIDRLNTAAEEISRRLGYHDH
jgi:IclR family KDG regulon transcriptional repressor